jgi:hypothetical protein
MRSIVSPADELSALGIVDSMCGRPAILFDWLPSPRSERFIAP